MQRRRSSRWTIRTRPCTKVWRSPRRPCNCTPRTSGPEGSMFSMPNSSRSHWRPIPLSTPRYPAASHPSTSGTSAANFTWHTPSRTRPRSSTLAGVGNGYVSVFEPQASFCSRWLPAVRVALLNSPWGLAIALRHFRQVRQRLLVGNFGDGLINAYDPTTGAFLRDLAGRGTARTSCIPGLWALYFGNGASGGDQNSLHFTAGPRRSRKHGIWAASRPTPT